MGDERVGVLRGEGGEHDHDTRRLTHGDREVVLDFCLGADRPGRVPATGGMETDSYRQVSVPGARSWC